MRIVMLHRPLGNQHSCLINRLDRGEISFSHLAVFIVNFHAAEQWNALTELTVIGHIIGDFKTCGFTEHKVIGAV